MSVGLGADPGFLAVSLQVTVINFVVGCHYFSPGLQLVYCYQQLAVSANGKDHTTCVY